MVFERYWIFALCCLLVLAFVLRLILRGLPNKSIATRLKIAEDTVRHHACAAYAVLGVSSRTEAMAAIARRGIRFD